MFEADKLSVEKYTRRLFYLRDYVYIYFNTSVLARHQINLTTTKVLN